MLLRSSMSSRRSPKPLSVTLVGERKETLSELHDYLVGAGVESRTCRSLRDAELPAQTAAVVLFPDEFEEHDVVVPLVVISEPEAKLI